MKCHVFLAASLVGALSGCASSHGASSGSPATAHARGFRTVLDAQAAVGR